MSIVTKEQQEIIERALVMGDLSKLDPSQRNQYYQAVCASLRLNPLTRPLEYIVLNGRLTLYARKDCTDQLRKIHGVSVRIAGREIMDDLMVVTAEATDQSGRTDSSIGAVSISNLRGEAKANALMKAETKARRRVTLALCGLGILDESEIESIPNARVGEPPARAPQRHADKLLEAPAPAEKLETPAPAAAAVVEPGDDGTITVDIHTIEEHKGPRGAPVWKVTTAGGQVYACLDQMIVSDLAEFRASERPVRIEWQRRGQRMLILSAEGVSE